MNFESLKLDFITYLKEKYGVDESENNLIDENISIFSYKKDFEEFLKDKKGVIPSIFSIDVSELESLDFNNGQFLSETREISEEENEITLGLLNDLIQQEEYFDEIDTDKNSTIDKSEAINFLSERSQSNSDSNEINIENLFSENTTKNTSENSVLDFGDDYNKIFSSQEFDTLTSIFDTDNDGIISEEENKNAISLLSILDGQENDFSSDDISIIKEYISGLSNSGFSSEDIKKNIWGFDGDINELSKKDFEELIKNINNIGIASIAEAIQEGIKTNTVMEANNAGTNPNTSSGPSGNSVSSPAYTEKNINNMSIKELESELETAKQETENAENVYLSELEKVDKELSNKIKENKESISSKEEELNNANTQLSELNTKIENDTTKLESAKSRIGDIDSNISELKQLLNNPEYNKTEIEAKISELIAEKNELNNQTIPSLEENIENNKGKVSNLSNNVIPQLELEIQDLNKEAQTYETELNNLAASNEGLKTQLGNYNNALEYVESIESILQSKKLSQEKAKNLDMPENSEAPKDYSNLEEYTFKNLPLNYNLDGQEYHCVNIAGYDTNGDGEIDFKPDSWEELQRYFLNGGVANIGKFGSMQCHNYSDVLGQFVLGDANLEFVQALYNETNDPDYGNIDKAGELAKSREWNPRRFAQCKAEDRDAERAIIENELQNGRPCLVSVPYTGGQHYAVAVGISDNGDILIWDSYNCSMEKLGKSSNSDSNKLHRNLATGNGVMVYCEGYSYQYSSAKLIDYWSYVDNSPEYVLENGYK